MTASPIVRAGRQVRALVLTALALLIISTAILVGLGRALSPYADQLRPWLEREMSARLGQVVEFEAVEAEWPRLTPSLSLVGLQLDDGQGNRLSVDRARLELHLPKVLDRSANPVRLVLVGLELVLAPDDEGRWGLQVEAGAAGDWRQQLPLGDLLIRDATVRVRPRQWPDSVFSVDEGRIERRGQETQFHGALSRADHEEQLDLRVLIEHPEGRWTAVRAWLGIEALALQEVARPIVESRVPASIDSRLDLQLWLDWKPPEQLLRLDLDLSVSAAAGDPPLRARALLHRDADLLQIEVDELTSGQTMIGSGLALGRLVEEGRTLWALAVDSLDLERLHAGLSPWLMDQDDWPAALSGQVQDLVVGLDDALSLHAAHGRIHDLQLASGEALPDIQGLDLALALAGDRLVLKPGGQPTAHWPRHIRGDMVLDAISGQLLLAPDSIELQGLKVESAIAHATADGWIYLHQPRPFLDFMIDVHRVGPTDPRPYLSHRTIPEPAMRWLDQSLVWIDDASGWVNLHLTAGTRARDLHPGSYQAVVDFRGAALDYWPGWPRAESVDGQVEFVGNRLSGKVEHARLGGVALAAPFLEIAELTAPTLVVELEASELDAGALALTLGEIPVAGWQAVVQPMRGSGAVDARTRLVLPFRRMADWEIEGEMRLERVELGLADIPLGFDALSGAIAFDRSGLMPTTLNARLAEQSFDLGLAARFSAPASLDLNARFNPGDFAGAQAFLGDLAGDLRGASQWSFRLEAGSEGLEMNWASDLQGLAVDWPSPLDKVADSAWPSRFRLSLHPDRRQLEFQLGERLTGRWAGDAQAWVLGLLAGQEGLPELPERGISLQGSLDRLAPAEWFRRIDWLAADPGSADLQAFDVQLAIERLELPGLSAGPATLALERAEEAWLGSIDSPEVAGSFTVPTPLDTGRAVIFDMSRLHLERVAEAPHNAEDEAGAHLDGISRFSPLGLPPLSLLIEDLRWGELELGRLRLESHPVEAGLEVELFDISGLDLRLQGRGRWVDPGSGPESQFRGRLSTSTLSALLRAAGYDAGLEAARAHVDLDVSWPGAPQDFALPRLLGTLEVRLSDGEIPEARPGAGRLLGLVSFNAIPRRLMLDFRDVFAAGMRFDDIQGDFALEGGFAVTDGLVLRSTAAVITISGQTDMAARRYDQEVLVEPGLGATLPVIGVLAGGPVGAAAGLVLRQLLERPLRGLAEVRYQVTGAWESPEIELVAARLPEEALNDDAARTSPP